MPGTGHVLWDNFVPSRAGRATATYGVLMPRPRRAELEPGTYHVNSRGAGGIPIFGDDDDRLLFLHLVARTIRRMDWEPHAYCLMTNHFHLLVGTRRPNLAQGMHVLVGTYARGFNERYGRRGHLFGGRYYSVAVEGEAQYDRARAYVVENPVRAGLCAVWMDWPWCGLGKITFPRAASVPDASGARHWTGRVGSTSSISSDVFALR